MRLTSLCWSISVLLAVSAAAAPAGKHPAKAKEAKDAKKEPKEKKERKEKEAGKPTLVVHPIVLERASRRGNEDLHAIFEQVVIAQFDVTPDADVDAFLEKQPGKTCQNQNPCLVALAKAVKAQYVLYATIAPNGPKLELSARVLKVDGKAVRTVAKLEAEKPADWTREAALEEGYKQLIAKLKLAALPGIHKPRTEEPAAEPTPEVTAQPQPQPQPEPQPEPQPQPQPQPQPVASTEPERRTDTPTAQPAPEPSPTATPAATDLTDTATPSAGSPVRTVGFVVGGLGVAAGIGAGVLALMAGGDAAKLTPDASGRVPVDQVDAALAMRTKASLAAGLGIGAGVAFAAGALLVLVAPAEKTRAALVPTAGGAALVVSGEFP